MDAKATRIFAMPTAGSGVLRMTGLNRGRGLAAFTIVLALVACCAAQDAALRRTSQYHGEALSSLLVRYAGVSVEIEPLKPRYLEGEDIVVHYRTYCSPPRPQPWLTWEFFNQMTLLRDGQRMGHVTSNLDFSSIERETASVFDDTMSISDFYDRDTRQRDGFGFLPAGQYTGYFDMGVVSPDYFFIIDPVPDSLQGDWAIYSQIRRLYSRSRTEITRATKDSLRRGSEYFLAKPVGAMWRSEALYWAFNMYTLFRDGNIWDQADSLVCVNLLPGLAREPDMNVAVIIGQAYNTLYRDFGDIRAGAALRELAERVQREDLLRAAENIMANPQR